AIDSRRRRRGDSKTLHTTSTRTRAPTAMLVSIGPMGAAFGWGAVAASSLVLGMLLGLLRPWPTRLIGLVLAFGAGALVSAVSFELFEEGVAVGGAAAVGIGLGAGAIVYFVLARAVE